MVDKKRGYILGAVAGVGLTLAAMVGTGLALPPAAAQSSEVKLYKASGLPVFAPPPGAPRVRGRSGTDAASG